MLHQITPFYIKLHHVISNYICYFITCCYNTKCSSVATVLVLQGILRKGCVLVAGQVWGKARGLFNENGKPIIQAMPSTPVVMTGWREVPSAGDKCIQVNMKGVVIN